jgi:hypothetical protein
VLRVALSGILALAAASPAVAADDRFDGQWRFSVTPYLWLPSISGSTTFVAPNGGGTSISADTNADSYLKSLEMAAMITGEVRKGEWSAFTDYIYLNFGNQRSEVKGVTGPLGNPIGSIEAGSSGSLKGSVWTLAGSYTAWRDKGSHLDVLAGFRYLSLESKLNWNLAGPLGALTPSGTVSKDFDKWDGIIGVKGMVKFGDTQWFMPYYADIGSGAANWTWQALLGVGYQYGWGAVTLSVRNLSYTFNGSDKSDVRFTGPALSATFAF